MKSPGKGENAGGDAEGDDVGKGVELAAKFALGVGEAGDAAVEKLVEALLKAGPEGLRAQKALLRQWEELPLTESVNLSVGTFGRSFLTAGAMMALVALPYKKWACEEKGTQPRASVLGVRCARAPLSQAELRHSDL